ncbi:MAG: hypothetical protein V9G98_14130 [Candidatus Competibacter sp.]
MGNGDLEGNARHATDWLRQGQGKRLTAAIGWNLFDLGPVRR